MRILHVEGGRNFYGGAHQILLLMEGLKSRGIENILACRRGSELSRLASSVAEVKPISMRGDLDVGLILRLIKVIRESHPDVIHLHSRIGADVMGGIAARLAGVPVVHSRRQDNPESRLAVALKYRLHDRIIAISKAIGQVLLKEGLPEQKLRCVLDAVEITPRIEIPDRAWFNKEFGLESGAPVLGVVAQLIPRKGHRVLIEAMPEILEAFPDTQVLFFGKGAGAAELEALIHQKSLSRSVRLAGFREDLERILPCIDVLVHPALREGMGVSLLQAQLARVAVVASAVGGIPEAIEDGVTGFLVPPDNPLSLSRAIVRLIGNPVLRKRMGERGRMFVESHFSSDHMVEGNLAVYRELV